MNLKNFYSLLKKEEQDGEQTEIQEYNQDSEQDNVDYTSISKYFVLTTVFCCIVAWVNNIVMKAIHLSPTLKVGNGIVSLYEIHNRGAAFNLFQGGTFFLNLIAIIAIIGMISYLVMNSKKLSYNAVSSMALLTAGILINMFQRIQKGYVIDYIHLDSFQTFPMFNTADILIVCGVLGILLALVVRN